jgi:hypothetical protein
MLPKSPVLAFFAVEFDSKFRMFGQNSLRSRTGNFCIPNREFLADNREFPRAAVIARRWSISIELR